MCVHNFESEVDYIIVAKRQSKEELEKDFNINLNEVKKIKALTLSGCENLVKQNIATPWFTKVVRSGLLAQWWTALDKDEINRDVDGSDTIIEL